MEAMPNVEEATSMRKKPPMRMGSVLLAALATGTLPDVWAEVTQQAATEGTPNAEEANLMTGEADLQARLASALDAALASRRLAEASAEMTKQAAMEGTPNA